MTPLRQRMIEDMQLRVWSQPTQRAYLQAIQRLALYYHKSPDQITDEELRLYIPLSPSRAASLPLDHHVGALCAQILLRAYLTPALARA